MWQNRAKPFGRDGATEKNDIASPLHNIGGTFSLPNLHNQIFLAILAYNFLQPRKSILLIVIHWGFLILVTSINQENVWKHLEKSIHTKMGHLEQWHKFTLSTKIPKMRHKRLNHKSAPFQNMSRKFCSHILCTLQSMKPQGTFYTGKMGSLRVTSRRGNK